MNIQLPQNVIISPRLSPSIGLRSHAARVALLAACAAFVASCSSTGGIARKDTSRTFTTVVVDAGHGGKDAGASRRSGPPEKAATLDVAQRLNRKLRESGFRTVMTRSSDVFVPLDRRVEIGNRQDNSIFISVHFNDSGRRGIHGFETYYASPYARGLAQRIQGRLLTLPGASNRGVHTANFRVVRNALYPSVLVECGFLSNRKEGSRAGSASYRELLADKIAEAIAEERHGSGVRKAPAAATAAAVVGDGAGAPSSADAAGR
jgi:N-acetylmuramoyl-L-alanine amidase